MTALPTSSAHDFDFIHGNWRVRHRRLRTRLAGCTEWIEFDGLSSTRPLLDGSANVEDNTLDLPGDAYRAVTLRVFDPASGRWSIWWLDGRCPDRLDVPVTGGFVDGRGAFFADDTFEGRPIRVRFRWLVHDADAARCEQARWEQAFSEDDGLTWETNWTMDFTRAA